MIRFKDLTGKKFGRLVVEGPAFKDNHRQWYWKCKCDCGNEVTVRGDHLRSGVTSSCGCFHSDRAKENFKDILGLKFGKLLVIAFSSRRSNEGSCYWLCKCDCGNEIEIDGKALRSGHTQTCGCSKEGAKTKARELYGELGVAIYSRWLNMRKRCLSPKYKSYLDYGGRGISICAEWEDIEVFCNWAIDSGFAPELELDRIDVNGNYCPLNCRWITEKEQNRNKRNNRMITYNGEAKCISEWAEKLKIIRSTLAYRLEHFATVEEAFFTPIKKCGRALGTKIL